MQQLLIALGITAILCMVTLSGIAAYGGYRWIEARLPREDDIMPPVRERPPSERREQDEEELVYDFVGNVDGLNSWAMNEWARQKIEEEGWDEDDVVQYLETREPIQFT